MKEPAKKEKLNPKLINLFSQYLYSGSNSKFSQIISSGFGALLI